MSRGTSDDGPEACDVLVEKLREEIVASQAGRYELAKWKLILSAALGGAGLGLTGSRGELALLLLVPLVCLYVDVLCHHGNFRILIIGKFLREDPAVPVAMRRYEEGCRKLRSHFKLEGAVLLWTSVVFSACVVLAGGLLPGHAVSKLRPEALRWALIGAGALGLVAAIGLQWWASARIKALDGHIDPPGGASTRRARG